jgi:hypothetical protein
MNRGFRWPRARDWFITPSSPTSKSNATFTTEIDWTRSVPFIFMHVACFSLFWVGWSWIAVGVASGLYVSRMLVIAAFYHRYFSHRSFKTSRWCQFAFAVLGCAAAQKGPLWWAAHHRHHHQYSDRAEDIHSPYGHQHCERFRKVPGARLPRPLRLVGSGRFGDRPLHSRVRSSIRSTVAKYKWTSDARLGILCLDRVSISRNLHDQLVIASARAPTI